MGFASDGPGQCLQLVGADTPALVKANLLMGLTVFPVTMAAAGGVAGLATFIREGEDHGHERLAAGLPVAGIGIGEDDLLVRHDLQLGAGAGDFLALRALHHHKAGATDPKIDLGLLDRLGLGREPLRHQIRVGPAAENLVAGGVQQVVQNQIVIF